MTTMAVPEQTRMTAGAATPRPSHGVLAGTLTLLRLVLRRDRVKLPAWLFGITSLLVYFATVLLPGIAESDADLADLRRIMDGSVGALFGPGYGSDAITQERYIVGVYGLFFFILAALMSMLLVARHTRSDEENGRYELVRSNVVGRHAPLTAVLVVAGGADLVLALLIGGTMTLAGHDGGQGLLFGASVGAVGLVAAGATAVSVQVFEHTRGATSMVGAVLGLAWVVRVAGDMIRDRGSALSWVSPLAWSNQTRPYADGRWWPLLLSIGLVTATAVGAYVLSARRDVGAGLVAPRAGLPEAPAWLRSPVTAAFRLHRASLIWWTVALAVAGFVFGGLAGQIADPEDMSADRLGMFGGDIDTVVDGYLGVMALIASLVAGIMVVLAGQAQRREETTGRLEPILATATSRRRWLGSQVVVVAIGLGVLLAVAGVASGLGATLSAGDRSSVWGLTVAHLAHVPAVLVLLGFAMLAFGLHPRAIAVPWTVLGLSLFVGVFGPLTDLPQWTRRLVPSDHVGRPPLDAVSWQASTVLLATAVGLVAAGLALFSRRDLDLT